MYLGCARRAIAGQRERMVREHTRTHLPIARLLLPLLLRNALCRLHIVVDLVVLENARIQLDLLLLLLLLRLCERGSRHARPLLRLGGVGAGRRGRRIVVVVCAAEDGLGCGGFLGRLSWQLSLVQPERELGRTRHGRSSASRAGEERTLAATAHPASSGGLANAGLCCWTAVLPLCTLFASSHRFPSSHSLPGASSSTGNRRLCLSHSYGTTVGHTTRESSTSDCKGVPARETPASTPPPGCSLRRSPHSVFEVSL